MKCKFCSSKIKKGSYCVSCEYLAKKKGVLAKDLSGVFFDTFAGVSTSSSFASIQAKENPFQ